MVFEKVRNVIKNLCKIYQNVKDYSKDEIKKIEDDLIKYCALDTFAVVKILSKLYEVAK